MKTTLPILMLCFLWLCIFNVHAQVPPAPGPIYGPSSICVASSGNTLVTFSIDPIPGATSYQWTPGGGPLATVGTTTGPSVTVSIMPNYPTSNMNIVVRGVNNFGVGTASPPFISQVINQIPDAGPMVGATVVNAGQTGVPYNLISPVPGASNYIWTYPGGSHSTTSHSTTINFPANFSGGQVRVYPQNGPCTSGSSFLNVALPPTQPGPAGNIEGPTSVCAGNTYPYTVPVISNASSYEWTPGGGPLEIIPPQNERTINLKFGAEWNSGNASLVVRGKNGAVTGTPSPTLSITVYRPVTATAVISGLTKVCVPHSNVEYSASELPYALSYYWMLDPGMTMVSGQGTRNIVINYEPGFSSGTVRVVGLAGPCGGGPVTTLNVSATTTVPATPGAISGTSELCNSASGMVYSISSVAGATGYVWSVPPGATITSGQGTTSITVSYNGSATNGSVSVYGTNCVGNGPGNSKAITMLNVAAPGIVSGSPNVGCFGTEVYSVTAVPGATSYEWSLPSGATISSGSGTTSITASFANMTSTTGTVKVRASNACGFGLYSPSLTVTKNKFTGPITYINVQTGTGVYVSGLLSRGSGVPWSPTSFGYTVPYNAYRWELKIENRWGSTVHSNSATATTSSGFANNSISWNGGSVSTGTYYVWLKLTNCSGSATYTGQLGVWNARMAKSDETAETLDVSDVTEIEVVPENELTVYPVPASGSVTLVYYLKQDTDVKIQLVDITGKQYGKTVSGYYGKGTHKTTLDVSSLAPAVYYFTMQTSYSKTTKQVPVVSRK